MLVGQHHGGDNSSSDCFIRAVSPRYVMFSAGGSHEHPAASTARRMHEARFFAAASLSTEALGNLIVDFGVREFLSGLSEALEIINSGMADAIAGLSLSAAPSRRDQSAARVQRPQSRIVCTAIALLLNMPATPAQDA